MRHLKRYKELWVIFGVSLALILGAGIWAYETLRQIREPLILHFSSYTGINQIGNLRDLLAMEAVGVVITLMNAMLAFSLEERDKILGRLVALASLFLAVLLFIGFSAIISVNS